MLAILNNQSVDRLNRSPKWLPDDLFLRATAECFVRLTYRLGICLSVCHTRDLYQNSASQDHEIFTVSCHKDSFLLTKFRAPAWRGSPQTKASKRGTL